MPSSPTCPGRQRGGLPSSVKGHTTTTMGRTRIRPKGPASDSPRKRMGKKSKTFSPEGCCRNSITSRGPPQSAIGGQGPHSSSRVPTAVIMRVESKGHPADPSADESKEDRCMGPHNAQNGVGHTKGSDHWGHRGARLATRGGGRHRNFPAEGRWGQEKPY